MLENWKKNPQHEIEGYTNCYWHAGAITRALVQTLEDLEIRGREETIQTTGLLKSARILRRVMET